MCLCVFVQEKEKGGESFIPGRTKEKILTRGCGAGRKDWKAECEVRHGDRKTERIQLT